MSDDRLPGEGAVESTREPGTLQGWSEVAEAIRATTRRLEKGRLLATYLARLDDASLPIAARFFSGMVFPRHDAGTTKVGGAIVFDALVTASGLEASVLGERYVAHGDLGDLAGELLATREPSNATLIEVERTYRALALASGTNARRELVRATLTRLGGLEARYLVKLLGGELRIGLKEAQVEEALAKTFGRSLEAIRRANLLRGDIGEVALAARRDALATTTLALFHPLGFMLAQPLPTAAEVSAALPAPFAIEDKYDGIRAQAHVGEGRVVLFSRTLDAIEHGYPDVVDALAGLPPGLVLDGELLAYDPAAPARALPFKALQQRLGRKRPGPELIAAVPVAFVAFDLLAADGMLVIDEPYDARRQRLEALPWTGSGSRLAPTRPGVSAADVEAAFAAARTAGNEGIVAKDRSARYAPGRRGGAWIKLKRPLATLDVVVVAVERGHGRRRAVLSDYTFAVRASDDDPSLLVVGKAYNGLTDAEIAALTPRFESLTIERAGGYHRVRPEVVLEVTFDAVQASKRHGSGYALRFPRIVRVRDDKPLAEIDTLARVRTLADAPQL